MDTNTNAKANANATGKRGRRRGRDSGTKEAIGNAQAVQPSIVPAPEKDNKREYKKPDKKQNSSHRSGATCSSPEPPKKAHKKLPKKVTPIPKVIRINTGKEHDQVSPMWMDTIGSSSSSSSSHIHNSDKKRRQLNFEGEKAASKPGVPPLPSALDAPKQSLSTIVKSKVKKNEVPNATATNSEHEKKRKRPLPAERNENGLALSSKKQKHSYGKDAPFTAARHNHLKLKSSLQPPSSFSRATSAYSTAQKANSKTTTTSISSSQPATKKKPLLDVYRSEVEKARKFMDEMVGNANTNTNKHDGQGGRKEDPISSVPAKS